MADLFDGYSLGEQWDEMFGGASQPRAAYAGLFASLQPMAGEELAARADVLSQTYRDAGVTFAHAGEEQPFPLDIVPRVIGAEEWDEDLSEEELAAREPITHVPDYAFRYDGSTRFFVEAKRAGAKRPRYEKSPDQSRLFPRPLAPPNGGDPPSGA